MQLVLLHEIPIMHLVSLTLLAVCVSIVIYSVYHNIYKHALGLKSFLAL